MRGKSILGIHEASSVQAFQYKIQIQLYPVSGPFTLSLKKTNIIILLTRERFTETCMSFGLGVGTNLKFAWDLEITRPQSDFGWITRKARDEACAERTPSFSFHSLSSHPFTRFLYTKLTSKASLLLTPPRCIAFPASFNLFFAYSTWLPLFFFIYSLGSLT